MTEGIAELRKGLENQAAMRCLIERPFCLTLLAESLVRGGQPHEALRLCDEALWIAQRTEARDFEPETHRVRGEALIAMGDPSRVGDARTEFAKAMNLAAATGCKALELRAAISNSRCKVHQAGAVLEPERLQRVVDGFLNESITRG